MRKKTHSNMPSPSFTGGHVNVRLIISAYQLSYVCGVILPLLSSRIHWKTKQIVFKGYMCRSVIILTHLGNISVRKLPLREVSSCPWSPDPKFPTRPPRFEVAPSALGLVAVKHNKKWCNLCDHETYSQFQSMNNTWTICRIRERICTFLLLLHVCCKG